MNARRFLMVAATAGALSCSDATAPARLDVYEWRLVVDADTLSFHWPRNTLPVKVWVQDTLDMPDRVQEGIEAWRGAFLYGEWDAALVADSSVADVVVRVTGALPAGVSTVARLRTMFPGCEGATDVDTAATRFQLRVPIRVYLTPRYDPASTDLTECFRVTATHELGHSLGIFRHAPDAAEIMYAQPVVAAPSARDDHTAEALTHYPANMTPVR